MLSELDTWIREKASKHIGCDQASQQILIEISTRVLILSLFSLHSIPLLSSPSFYFPSLPSTPSFSHLNTPPTIFPFPSLTLPYPLYLLLSLPPLTTYSRYFLYFVFFFWSLGFLLSSFYPIPLFTIAFSFLPRFPIFPSVFLQGPSKLINMQMKKTARVRRKVSTHNEILCADIKEFDTLSFLQLDNEKFAQMLTLFDSKLFCQLRVSIFLLPPLPLSSFQAIHTYVPNIN